MCFRSDTPDASGGILFSGLSEKSMQKRDAGDANSAYAQKKLVVPFCVLSLHRPSSERPSGGRPIGFPKRTMYGTSRFICAR